MNKSHSFWAMETGPETARLLKDVLPNASDAQLQRLVAAALTGPPRDYFLKNLSDEKFAKISRRETWLRLSVIQKTRRDIGAEAINRLALLSKEFQQPPSERELGGFAVYHSPINLPESPLSANDFMNTSAQKVATFLLDNQEDTFEGEAIQREWRVACYENPEHALTVLECFAGESKRGESFATFLEANRAEPLEDEVLNRILPLVTAWHLQFAELHALCDFLTGQVPKGAGKPRQAYWPIWKRAAVFAAEASAQPISEHDWLVLAMNHPVGKLAGAAVALIEAEQERAERPNRSWALCALEWLSGDESIAGGPVHALLGRSLPYLHAVNSNWTEKLVIPLFDWDKARVPLAAWQGFLHSPSWTVRLFALLAPQLMKTHAHANQLSGDALGNIGVAVASASLDCTGLLPTHDVKHLLEKLPEEGRVGTLRWLIRRLKQADTSVVAGFWTQQLEPWLGKCWPKSKVSNAGAVAEHLCLLAIATLDAFPKSQAWIRKFASPPPNPWWILQALDDSSIPDTAPIESADFSCWVLTSEGSAPPPAVSILNRVVKAGDSSHPSIIALQERSHCQL